MAEKHLTEAAWKSFAKSRTLKDAAMLKALADFGVAERGAPDAQLKCLDAIDKQAQALMKLHKADKEVSAYLGEIDKALSRARRAAEQAAKDAAKSAAKPADDDEEEDSPALLTTKMLPLLRLAIRGEPMQVLVASGGKKVVVMLSRKPIAAARRKLLAAELDASGGIKYFTGQCVLEDSAATFVLQTQVAGMAKKIKAALLAQTGLRLNKLRCRGQDGETDDDDDAVPGGTVPEGPGAAGPVATGPSAQALSQARTDWGAARRHAVGELTRLKGILQTEYSGAGEEQAALASALQRVDATIAAIDDELGMRLEQLMQAPSDRRAEVAAAAKAAAERLVKLVGTDQILQTIDGNELAPEMVVAEPLRTRLQQIAATLA